MLFSLQTISGDAQREKGREKEGLTDTQTEREIERDRTVEPTIALVRSPSSSPSRDSECFVHPTPAKEDPSHSADPFFIVIDLVNDPPLSQSDRHEKPTPEQPTPKLTQ